MVIFTLAPADDFSDLWHQHIHCAHCLSVLVQLHVKGLYLFWVVHKY